MNLSAFQACDIRGVFGDDLSTPISPGLAHLVGQAIAEETPPNQKIVLGGDGRTSTPLLLSGLRKGIGRPCIDLGYGIPTPLLYVAREIHSAYTSIMVTASHNPPQYNGLKIQIGPRPVTPERLERIRQRTKSLPPPPLALPLHAVNPPGESLEARSVYCSDIYHRFPEAEGRIIAIDCMHGCMSSFASEALGAHGYQVTAIRNTQAGDFHGLTPDPSTDQNLTELMETVRTSGAQFGAALDGDGDRVRFVDETGTLLDNGAALVLFSKFPPNPDTPHSGKVIVYDQKMRLSVLGALRQSGLSPLRERSGHTFIRSRVLDEDAMMGGEVSGHLFWGKGRHLVRAGDCGLYSIFAMGELLRNQRVKLSELAAEVPPSPYYTGDIRDLCCVGNREEWLEKLAKSLRNNQVNIDTTDGIRIDTKDTFFHIRPSVTEQDKLTAVLDADKPETLLEISGLVLANLPHGSDSIQEKMKERTTIC